MTTEKPETIEKTIWNTKEKCTVCKDNFHSKNDMRAIQNTKMCTVCVAELAVKNAIQDNSQKMCPDCKKSWHSCKCGSNKYGR